jgi:hypothetical protein
MKQEATDVQPKDLTAIRQAQPTRYIQLHQPYILEPHMNQSFTPELQVQLGLRKGNGEHYHGET